MKRLGQDLAGRPKGSGARRRDVAGCSISRRVREAAMYCTRIESARTAPDDALLVQDFEDFLSGGATFEARTGLVPDPVFVERLRQRLWRNYLVSQHRNARTTIH